MFEPLSEIRSTENNFEGILFYFKPYYFKLLLTFLTVLSIVDNQTGTLNMRGEDNIEEGNASVTLNGGDDDTVGVEEEQGDEFDADIGNIEIDEMIEEVRNGNDDGNEENGDRNDGADDDKDDDNGEKDEDDDNGEKDEDDDNGEKDEQNEDDDDGGGGITGDGHDAHDGGNHDEDDDDNAGVDANNEKEKRINSQSISQPTPTSQTPGTSTAAAAHNPPPLLTTPTATEIHVAPTKRLQPPRRPPPPLPRSNVPRSGLIPPPRRDAPAMPRIPPPPNPRFKPPSRTDNLETPRRSERVRKQTVVEDTDETEEEEEDISVRRALQKELEKTSEVGKLYSILLRFPVHDGQMQNT